jgi:hypothetical protein
MQFPDQPWPFQAGGANVDNGAAARRLFYRINEAQLGVSGPINQSRPVADPQNQTAASTLSFYNTARIVLGSVTDTSAIGHVYRVQFEKAKQPMVAVKLSSTMCNASGIRDLTTIQPGAMVACIVHAQLSYAIIIAVIPHYDVQSLGAHASILFGATRARVDEAHRRPYRFEGNHVPAFLAGRPYDSTTGGEAGWISATGAHLFVDEKQASVGVDEMCRLAAMVDDQLLRLTAFNLQLWTSGSEREGLLDQGEYSDWTGYTPYPWEQLGAFLPSTETLRTLTAEEWQKEKPWYQNVEPVDDKQLPWHREREFHGYLGQGGKRIVQGPPVTDEALALYGQTLTYPGLFDQTVTMDGRLLIQTARGMSVAKRATIISPARKAPPPQPDTATPPGDAVSNYRFAGRLGEGPEHKISGGPIATGSDPGIQRAMAVLDLHAYFFNYAGSHPFFYHANDFHLPEEADLSYVEGQSCKVPDFSVLSEKDYIDPGPAASEVHIDHRYGFVNIYRLTCGYDLLEDGGAVYYGGMGEEIRMAGGTLNLSAPGDINIRAGRNINLWAGRDLIFKAKHAADLTVSDGDIRHKAEKNYYVLSGNSGKGGTFLENRAEASAYTLDEPGEQTQMSGITLKSKTDTTIFGSSIYIRSPNTGTDGGVIVLDAGQGAGQIITNSYSIDHFVNGGSEIRHAFGDNGIINTVNSFAPDGAKIGGGLSVEGAVRVSREIDVTGNIYVAQGHIYTEVAQTTKTVSPLQGALRDRVYDEVSDVEQTIKTRNPATAERDYTSRLATPLYGEGKRGHSTFISDAQVSLRSLADYKSATTRIYEDRWQQMARLSGQSVGTWQETAVVWRGRETYPYPGRGADSTDDPRFWRQDLKLVDLANNGKVKKRSASGPAGLDDAYASPEYAEPTTVSLDDYPIIDS